MIAAAHIREGGDFVSIASDDVLWARYLWLYNYMCPEILGTVLTAFCIFSVALPRNFRFLSVVSMASVPLTVASVTGALYILYSDKERVSLPLSGGYKAEPWGSDIPHRGDSFPHKVNAILCVIFTFLIQPTSPAVMSDMKKVK